MFRRCAPNSWTQNGIRNVLTGQFSWLGHWLSGVYVEFLKGPCYHIISYHIIYHIIYIISYHIISYHITSYIIYYLILYYLILYLILSYLILSYHIISYRIMSYHLTSCHILYYIILYYIILYYIILYYIILYYILNNPNVYCTNVWSMGYIWWLFTASHYREWVHFQCFSCGRCKRMCTLWQVLLCFNLLLSCHSTIYRHKKSITAATVSITPIIK